ncbi:MAG: glutamate mutase L [Anaerolineae bacterium]|nr:glutamate mutase L [Anaerolineae bacterium]
MAREQRIGSILAIDCGTVLTKALLLDIVDGSYRFVARGSALTTAGAPWNDVAQGIQHAIEQVEDMTGWMLLDEARHLIVPQQKSMVGVDACVAVSSAAAPLRLVLAGLVPEMSIASARRAISRTYAVVEDLIVHAPHRAIPEEEQVRKVLRHHPDAVCVVGGTDGGATLPVLELVEAVALACAMLPEGTRPQILFAGNTALRQKVVDVVGGQAPVRSIDNVRPSMTSENLVGLQTELDAIYREKRLAQLPGSETLHRWLNVPLMPVAESFARHIQYLWYLDESPKGTLGIDVGAAHTLVTAVFGGEPVITVAAGMGSVYGADRLLAKYGAEAFLRWMPVPLKPEQVPGILLHRALWPASVPQEPEELWLEQGVVREVMREALRVAQANWRPDGARPYPHLMPLLDPIVVSGGALTSVPRPGQVALMVIDAVEPVGISTLLLDAHGLATVLGAVSLLKPLAAVETLDNGGLINLATVIAPIGTARKGETVLRIRVHYEKGGSLDVEVPYGSLEVLPLPVGEEAVLEIRPRGRIDVGLGPGRGGKRRVRGGLVGLIVDARGRPLQLPTDPYARMAQIQQWLWDMGG